MIEHVLSQKGCGVPVRPAIIKSVLRRPIFQTPSPTQSKSDSRPFCWLLLQNGVDCPEGSSAAV